MYDGARNEYDEGYVDEPIHGGVERVVLRVNSMEDGTSAAFFGVAGGLQGY